MLPGVTWRPRRRRTLEAARLALKTLRLDQRQAIAEAVAEG